MNFSFNWLTAKRGCCDFGWRPLQAPFPSNLRDQYLETSISSL